MKRLWLVLLAVAISASPTVAQREINRKIWVAPDGYIRLFNMTGSVRIQGWDQDSMQITGTASWSGDGEFVVSPGKQGAKASLWGSTEKSARGELVVRVPRRSQLWVKTQDASVSINDFEGGLDVITISGTVDIVGRPRELYVESMGGNVNLSVSTRSARVKTGSGAVTVRGAIDDATVTTVSGAIQLMDSRIRQGRLESIEGRVVYSGDFAAPGKMEFINHAGSTELQLGPKATGEFSISTFEGHFRDEYGLRLRHGEGKMKGREFGFTLGGMPDNEVSIRTFKGPVVIRKLGPTKSKAL